MRKIISILSIVAVGVLSVSTASAVTPRFNGTQMTVDPEAPATNLILTVSGPRRYYETASAKSGPVTIELQTEHKLVDGIYRWQLTGATSETVKLYSRKENDGRDKKDRGFTYGNIAHSGTFRVFRGARVDPNQNEKGAADRTSKEDRVEE